MATINVNLEDFTGNSITITVQEGTTFEAVLEEEDAQAFFEASDADPDDDIKDYISEINGVDVEDNETLRDMLLRSTPTDGNTIEFSFMVDEDEDEDEDGADEGSQTNGGTATGARGVVIVELGGGLQTARIDITNGATTVREAVFNETVRRRSGMNDEMLNACTIRVIGGGSAGNYISGSELDNTRVTDGQVIEVNQRRVAATKG